MYTLSLLLLTLFSLYIGVFAFFRWDASFLRNMNHAPVQALFILAFAVLLAAALLLLRAAPQPALRTESEAGCTPSFPDSGAGTASVSRRYPAGAAL